MQKTWLITGASSGLGEALTVAVMENGDRTVATFRDAAAATAFSAQYAGRGVGIVMDVTQPDQVTAGIDKAIAAFGGIDVLVNNAGYGTVGAVEEFSMEEIREQMETNFFGMVMLTKALLPHLRERMGGHILQLSSAAGIKATGGFGIYNASKFALEGFSEALAQEVAPFHIKVVIIEPGPFRTQFAGRSVKLAQHRIEAYSKTPVAQMYHYISRIGGRQEGDPAKGAAAIVRYVHEEQAALRLPLGKHALDAIRAKLVAVQKDLDANEATALSVMY